MNTQRLNPSRPPPASRSQSRGRFGNNNMLLSSASSARSVPILPQGGEEIINPDGNVGVDAAELIASLVNGDVDEELRLREEEESSTTPTTETAARDQWHGSPWYKRPSPWWLICMTPFVAAAMSACAAPRIQLYTELACRSHKPEYSTGIVIPPSDITGGGISMFNTRWPFQKIPEPSDLCINDPEVKAAVASLIASLSTSMGILSCLTTAFWTQLSDVHGRRLIMGIAIFGTLIGDFTYLLVGQLSDILPGNYRFLIFGPLADGLLGGFITAQAANHAYIADCTDTHTRVKYFSYSAGLLFSGVGIGPTLGGLLVRHTGDLLSVFYLGTMVHFMGAFIVWFLIPESLSNAAMEKARREQKEAALTSWKRIFSFLSPITMLLPKKVYVERNGWTRSYRDWNLTLVAICMSFMSLIFASYQFKLQYATNQFKWRSEELGYWLSMVGVLRALLLGVILPLFFKYFKPKPPAIQLSTTPAESDPLLPHQNDDYATKSVKFDLMVARFSLLIEIIGYSFIIFVTTSTGWIVYTFIASLSGGFHPAMQSVALELYRRRGETEVGKLYGALSVLSSIGSQIIGPTMFGLIYMSTASTFPQAMFIVCAMSITAAFTFTLFVRMRPTLPKNTLIRVDTETYID